MKLSVIVMSYNFEHYIYDCLKSIVEQGVDFEYEVLVGDDCSKDSSAAIIMEFADKYPGLIRPIIHKTNIGAINNYFYLLNSAQGEYIAYIDGDDYMLPSKLQNQVDYLDSNDDCSMVVHSHIVEINNTHRNFPIVTRGKYDINYFLANDLFFTHGSKMFRKHPVYKEVFPKSVVRHPDILLHIQSLLYGKVGYIPEFLCVYRKHSAGLSSLNQKMVHEIFREKMVIVNYLKSKNVIGDIVNQYAIDVFVSKSHYVAALGYLRLKNYLKFKYHMKLSPEFIKKKAFWKRFLLRFYICPKLFAFLIRV